MKVNARAIIRIFFFFFFDIIFLAYTDPMKLCPKMGTKYLSWETKG